MKKIRRVNGFCAPAALRHLSGLEDRLVLEICARHGFHPSTGMDEFEILAAAKSLNIRLRRVNLKKKGFYRSRLRKFRAHHRDGKYILCTHNHIFVLDMGSIVDPLWEGFPGLDRYIVSAWMVF